MLKGVWKQMYIPLDLNHSYTAYIDHSYNELGSYNTYRNNLLYNREQPSIFRCLGFPPVAWGDRNSANVCPCACSKRLLIMGYKLSYTTGLLYA